MSWKCDICDTYNDTHLTACYVCGEPRSAASIRAEKRRAREERVMRISTVIYEKVFRVLRIMFYAGWITSLAVIVLTMIVKIVQGNVGGVAVNLGDVLEHMGSNLVTSFTVNGREVLQSLLTPLLGNVGDNFVTMLASWGETLDEVPGVLKAVFVRDTQPGHLSELFSNIGTVWRNATGSVSNMVDIVKMVCQNVQQYF